MSDIETTLRTALASGLESVPVSVSENEEHRVEIVVGGTRFVVFGNNVIEPPGAPQRVGVSGFSAFKQGREA